MALSYYALLKLVLAAFGLWFFVKKSTTPCKSMLETVKKIRVVSHVPL
jgi:hypothetical protein